VSAGLSADWFCHPCDRIHWASDQIEIHVFKDGSRLVTGYYGQLEL